MKKEDAITLVQEYRAMLIREGYPIRDVILFGSAAKGEMHRWSDIDVAVVCDPFLDSKYDERTIFSRLARRLDVRLEVVCLHPEDFENRFFTLCKEIKRYGVPA